MTNSALLLFGPPGSGKGTQAVLLSEFLHIPHISTGDIFRQSVKEGTELGKQVQAIMNAGQLVPDELVDAIVAERLAQPDCRDGYILDGYPRTVHQAENLDCLLLKQGKAKVVVNLLVDYNIIVARITARRSCPVCGASYNLVSNPPKRDAVCDRDGAALVQRADDTEDVMRKRFQAYDEQTLPVMDFFRANGYKLVEVVGGNGAPEDLTKQILERLKQG
ncbi:MAG: adenylate kinase [Acidobacteriota bacterium]